MRKAAIEDMNMKNRQKSLTFIYANRETANKIPMIKAIIFLKNKSGVLSPT